MVNETNVLDVELCYLIKNKSHNMNHPLMNQPLIKCTPIQISLPTDVCSSSIPSCYHLFWPVYLILLDVAVLSSKM